MAEQEKKGNDQGGGIEQDPWVERLRPEPSAPPSEVATLEGLAGKSDRDGWARIYFNTSLTYYAEFRREDVVYTEAVPAEQAPMKGLKSTRVGVRKDAVIEYTRTTRARPRGGMDLDVQLAAARPRLAAQPDTFFDCPATIGVECPTQPFGCVTDPNRTCGCPTGRTDCICPTVDTCGRTICIGHTCIEVCDTQTCPTVCGNTCQTCATRCNQPTCQATCQTCATRCGQATCNTCQTQCGQATCNTCRTQCDQVTCDTCGIRCPTINPHVFTCGPRCVEP
jgi:hypothetical protein